MRVLLEKNLGFRVSAISKFCCTVSLLQLALSSSLVHFATPFMARFTVHLISFNSNPRMSTTQNPRIREMSSKIWLRCLYSPCLWLMAIQSCNSYHFLIMEIFIWPVQDLSNYIPGVLNLQGFNLSKSRSWKPTLCERRERKVDGLPLFRISAEGAWFIWVLQGMKIQTNYCKSILVNQPVSWELMLVPHHATRRLCVIPKKRLTYFTHFTYVPQPGVGWGGGGGVGCNDMHCHAHNCTCAHVGCYAIALAHMLDATQLHLRTCWMLRNCTCAHVGCYAIALAHMLDATQLHLRTCWMLRNCTCAHVGCYAIALAHMLDATQLHLRTCWMLRNCTCAHVRCYAIALAHMLDATQLHLRTCWMLRNCTCAHVRCYANALAHIP